MIRITFIDGKLKLSNDVLMKIPYFAELLAADPSLKKTHLDYEKAKFLVMLEKLTSPMETFLKIPATPGKSIPIGFDCCAEQIKEYKEEDYYITNINSVLENFKLKSDKNNYTFDIVKSDGLLIMKHKRVSVFGVSYTNNHNYQKILISKDSSHLLTLVKYYDVSTRRYETKCTKYYFKEIE